MKKPDKALEDIDAAIKLQPNAGPAAFDASRDSGRDQSASIRRSAELESLLKAAPGNVALLNRLGSFYLVAGQAAKGDRHRVADHFKGCR